MFLTANIFKPGLHALFQHVQTPMTTVLFVTIQAISNYKSVLYPEATIVQFHELLAPSGLVHQGGCFNGFWALLFDSLAIFAQSQSGIDDIVHKNHVPAFDRDSRIQEYVEFSTGDSPIFVPRKS